MIDILPRLKLVGFLMLQWRYGGESQLHEAREFSHRLFVRKVILLAIVLGVVFFRSGPAAWGQEVPYTLEDRDRLIRVEATLKEFKESVDKRIEGVDERIDSVDKRIERLETVMMGGFGLLFTSMIGLVGFVLWDRRSALAPAIRRSRELGRCNGIGAGIGI